MFGDYSITRPTNQTQVPKLDVSYDLQPEEYNKSHDHLLNDYARAMFATMMSNFLSEIESKKEAFPQTKYKTGYKHVSVWHFNECPIVGKLPTQKDINVYDIFAWKDKIKTHEFHDNQGVQTVSLNGLRGIVYSPAAFSIGINETITENQVKTKHGIIIEGRWHGDKRVVKCSYGTPTINPKLLQRIVD